MVSAQQDGRYRQAHSALMSLVTPPWRDLSVLRIEISGLEITHHKNLYRRTSSPSILDLVERTRANRRQHRPGGVSDTNLANKARHPIFWDKLSVQGFEKRECPSPGWLTRLGRVVLLHSCCFLFFPHPVGVAFLHQPHKSLIIYPHGTASLVHSRVNQLGWPRGAGRWAAAR